MPGSTTDWDRIRSIYITGDMSFRALSKSENVNQSTLTGVATKQKWHDQRLQYRKKMAEKHLERAEKREVESLDRLKSVADRTIRKAEQLLDRIGDDDIDGRELKTLADAITALTALGRDLHGIPSQPEQHKQMIAEERLQIAREQAQIEREKLKLGADIQIVLRGTPTADAEEDWEDIGG